jgi:hypothetical protein
LLAAVPKLLLVVVVYMHRPENPLQFLADFILNKNTNGGSSGAGAGGESGEDKQA